MAAVFAVGDGAVLSHRSTAQAWRLVPRTAITPELTKTRGWRSPSGIVVHVCALRADEIDAVDDLPVTSVSRTLFDLAGQSTERQLERAMNEAEILRLTDRLSVPDLMERYPRYRGTVTLRRLLAAKTPGGITRNDFEESFVAFLDAYRLPRPRLNATLPLRGRLLEVDCMWREQRLVVELDSRAIHDTERAFESDRRRDRTLLAEGWSFARVTWRHLHDEPAAVAEDLRAVLDR